MNEVPSDFIRRVVKFLAESPISRMLLSETDWHNNDDKEFTVTRLELRQLIAEAEQLWPFPFEDFPYEAERQALRQQAVSEGEDVALQRVMGFLRERAATLYLNDQDFEANQIRSLARELFNQMKKTRDIPSV